MFLLKVVPINDFELKITGYQVSDEKGDTSKIVEVNEVIYRYVVDLFENNILTYPNSIKVLVIEHIKSTPIDSVVSLQNNAISSYKRYYVDRVIDSEFYITFIEFTNLNNKLSSKGYFITDENREEMYIEILTTGDVDLITILENYLNLKDTINLYDYHFKRFIEFKKDIRNTYSVSDVKEMYNKFTGESLTDVVAGWG